MLIIYGTILAVASQVFGKLYGRTDKMQETTWQESLLSTVEDRLTLIECGANCESFSSCNAFRYEKDIQKCEMAELFALIDTSESLDKVIHLYYN